MEQNFKQVLTEQVIYDFHRKGLDDLITFFVVKYPNFTYTDLDIEHLIPEYLRVYDIPFLASYIRYSDLSLLGSGMRDLAVKEKLYYLHYHIGTICHAYRKFIWSDDITLEDLKRWLPLLSNFRLKTRIMRCTKISESFKRFVDLCLEENSFAYQNLILLDDLYSTVIVELERIGCISNQETFYKLLKIIMESGLSISFDQLLQCFYKLEKLLELIPIQLLSQYSFMIEEYLREFRYFPTIHNIEEFQVFRDSKEKAHLAFLENETDLSSLKEFYSLLFLGMPYQKFQKVFMTLSSDSSKQYQLLKILYESIFPFSLKKDLYYQFMNYGSLESYLEDQIKLEDINDLNLVLTSIDEDRSLITMDHSSFHFIMSSTYSYKSSKVTLKATIQNDTNFVYQKDCLFGYSNPEILFCDEHTCVLKRNGLKPDFLIAFDQVSFKHLAYQKVMGIPIVVIDTEAYVQKLIHSLEEKFASQDWTSYIRLKKNLFFAIQKHPWLLVKYFTSETLYEDVRCLEQNLEIWIFEKAPSAFLKKQLKILGQLNSANEALEEILVIGKKTSFQYRKKMLQYESITEP